MIRRVLLWLLLLAAVAGCGQRETPRARSSGDRTPRPVGNKTNVAPPVRLGDVDWRASAGIFIGVQHFRAHDAPPDVDYASDDATDLAYYFAIDAPRPLPKSNSVLLISGKPAKPSTATHLQQLRDEITVIEDGVGGNLDEETIYRLIQDQASRVGSNGLLVVSIATHGYMDAGQHVLLTSNSANSACAGVTVDGIFHALESTAARVLLFVDACRARLNVPFTGKMWEQLPAWRAYAVLSAAAPGGVARTKNQNGLFTYALLQGLRCNAPVDAEGFLLLDSLNTYVSRLVVDLSGGRQQPEARYSGGLGHLRLSRCGHPEDCNRILRPSHGTTVVLEGDVELEVCEDGLYATVLVCARKNGICYNQNPGFVPIHTRAGERTTIRANYGSPDTFAVYVMLTADSDFLRGKREFSGPPQEQTAVAFVHRLGPVEVTYPE